MAADVGATLAKLVVRRADGRLGFRLVPSHAIEQAAREVERLLPDRLGLTGGGAPELARLLGFDTDPVREFDAWRVGSRALLARQGEPPGERDVTRINRVIRETLEPRGFAVVDLLPVFQEASAREALFFDVDGHWSAAGHRTAAKTIATALRTRGALQPRRH